MEQFIDELHNPKSPNFHKWLTATDFGKKFGLAESDIQTITGWLESQGFTVNSVYPSGMVIDFSGNAGQVRRAFHTSIHNLERERRAIISPISAIRRFRRRWRRPWRASSRCTISGRIR